MQEDRDRDTGIVVIFFRYNDKKLSVRDTLAAIARQLLEDHDCAFGLVKTLYDNHIRRSTKPSKQELVVLLRQVTRQLKMCFVTLDALDEAPETVQLEIFQTLSTLRINIFATGRPEVLREQNLAEALFVEIMAQKEDIAILVRETVKKNHKFQRLLQANSQIVDWEGKVISTVQERSRGM